MRLWLSLFALTVAASTVDRFTLNDPISKKPITVQNGAWPGSDNYEGKTLLRVNQGTPLALVVEKNSTYYRHADGYFALRDIQTGLYVRLANNTLHLNKLHNSGLASDFGWKFADRLDGLVDLINDFNGGSFMGYDDAADQVIAAAESDPRVFGWAKVPYGEFNLVHPFLNAPLSLDPLGALEVEGYEGRSLIRLGASNEMVLTAKDVPEVYRNADGFFGLQDISTGLYLRHAGFYLHANPLNNGGPDFDFGWKFVNQNSSDGTVEIFNDYEGGWFVGYDEGFNGVLIVEPTDARRIRWRKVDIKGTDNFILFHPVSGLSWVYDPSGWVLPVGFEGTALLRLNATAPLSIEAYLDDAVHAANRGFYGLKEKQQGDFLRHAFNVMRTTPLNNGGPAYDFAWKFIQNADGTVKVYNEYDGGVYMAFDSFQNTAVIVKESDSLMTSWIVDFKANIQFPESPVVPVTPAVPTVGGTEPLFNGTTNGTESDGGNSVVIEEEVLVFTQGESSTSESRIASSAEGLMVNTQFVVFTTVLGLLVNLFV